MELWEIEVILGRPVWGVTGAGVTGNDRMWPERLVWAHGDLGDHGVHAPYDLEDASYQVGGGTITYRWVL